MNLLQILRDLLLDIIQELLHNIGDNDIKSLHRNGGSPFLREDYLKALLFSKLRSFFAGKPVSILTEMSYPESKSNKCDIHLEGFLTEYPDNSPLILYERDKKIWIELKYYSLGKKGRKQNVGTMIKDIVRLFHYTGKVKNKDKNDGLYFIMLTANGGGWDPRKYFRVHRANFKESPEISKLIYPKYPVNSTLKGIHEKIRLNFNVFLEKDMKLGGKISRNMFVKLKDMLDLSVIGKIPDLPNEEGEDEGENETEEETERDKYFEKLDNPHSHSDVDLNQIFHKLKVLKTITLTRKMISTMEFNSNTSEEDFNNTLTGYVFKIENWGSRTFFLPNSLLFKIKN